MKDKKMSVFEIESEDLNEKSKEALSSALCGVAEGDLPFVVEIVFFSPEEIKAVNLERRGVDAVTDVLSFPSMDGIKGKPILIKEHPDCMDENRIYLGDVAVCCERAVEQAAEYGHSYERELNYLIVHGILHCLGYDHMNEEDKKEMRLKEEEIMARMQLTR